MSTPAEVPHNTDSTDNINDDALHELADTFVSGMDRTQRVVWLKGQDFTDRQILDALLDTDDGDLDGFCRDAAHGVAADAANGALSSTPPWLR